MSVLGIFSKTFVGGTVEEVFRACRDAGYDNVQFNWASVGLQSLPQHIPDAAVEAVRVASRASGLSISAVSGTYNMAHPDRTVRAAGAQALRQIIETAPRIGAGCVTICTGSRDAVDQWRWHPDNATSSAWHDLVGELRAALGLAEATGVVLGVEPEHANVVSSAERAAQLIKESESPALKIVFDPANIVEAFPTDQWQRRINDATSLLGSDIVLAHAKDRTAAGEVCAAGEGAIDLLATFKALKAIGFHGPVITHGLRPAEAATVAQRLRGLLREAGL